MRIMRTGCSLGAGVALALGFAQGAAAAVTWWAVDPMAETKFMPDEPPPGGLKGEPVRIIAAQDEYEPGSFVLTADEDLGKVEFRVGDLKAADGATFSARELDLKTVKVWYQNQNAWYSYFADDTLKLCPELLLNDEDLVKVDEKKVANYARLTEPDGKTTYHWLTSPKQVENRIEDAGWKRIDDAFCSMKPNFMDAPKHAGATIEKGRHKQFFLTAHAAKDAKPGLYTGEIELYAKGAKVGAVPVSLRILPFALPRPCTYFDCRKEFFVWFCSYIGYDGVMDVNGGDRELATRQLRAICIDFAKHNQIIPDFSFDGLDEVAKEYGLDLKHRGYGGMLLSHNKAEMRFSARRTHDRAAQAAGEPVEGYVSWGDEYSLNTLRRIRDMVQAYQEEGLRFTVNSTSGYAAAGYLADLWWPPTFPDANSKAKAEHFNALGGDNYFGWYACHHVGVENPAFIRRQYGMGAYRAGLSCHYNYAHHLQGWNDVSQEIYRPMMFVYGVGNGCLDTLQWEGFREGMDDIRYATKLQQLAQPLARSMDNLKARYAAKKALQFLADLDGDDYDLTTTRLEMIRHILKLMEVSK